MSKNPRVIGTTDLTISIAEADLGVQFPTSFRAWLEQNNGRSLDDVVIFPVFDERDPRKTSDSIVRNFRSNWKTWLENFGSDTNSSHLLPFGEVGTGDYFCFDFSKSGASGEPIVAFWSHETGETEFAANDFAEFVELVESGELEY